MPKPLQRPPVLRILVADHASDSRAQLCAMVKQSGHTAIGVERAQALLARVAHTPPDLVLLELGMPEADAAEIARQLKTLLPDRWLPLIVTTPLYGEEHFIRALQHGADDYLVRPMNPALLDAKLRHYAQVLGLQSRLASLAQQQQDIHNNMLDAVITLNASGLIEEANLAAVRSFGIASQRLQGQHCQAILGVDLATLLSQRECALTRADGSLLPAELAVSQWGSARHIRYTIVVRDLTERRHIDRMKDEFLATVSHELRTPLTSVLGALGLLASGAVAPLPAALLPLTDIAKRNGERLSRLIDDVLDLTKLEGNQMVLQLRPAALAPLLQEAINANQGYAQRSQVQLCLEVPTSTTQVRVDADRFLQIMANLLSNAIKHSPAQGKVYVSTEVLATHVRIQVRDHGPGVSPQFRHRMFDKFSQADGSDRRAQGGTGLGLYITRMLVERMEGRVGVDSVAGQGATFYVELPRDSTGAIKRVPWVLHIDRDVDARRRVALWLSGVCKVESAADLAQARAHLGQRPAPVILADPQAQGVAQAFCTALKKIGHKRGVILWTDAVDAQFVRTLGFQWLQKTDTGCEALQAAVQSALRASREGPAP